MDLSETCRVIYKINLRQLCISLAFIIRKYHDARSTECEITTLIFQFLIVSSRGYGNTITVRDESEDVFLALSLKKFKKTTHPCLKYRNFELESPFS
jgi:hypothetical protein